MHASCPYHQGTAFKAINSDDALPFQAKESRERLGSKSLLALPLLMNASFAALELHSHLRKSHHCAVHQLPIA